MRLGIKIDDLDLYDWKKILVKERNIGHPNKKKIIEHIPYSNTPLDFSELYGEGNFDERSVEYTLTLIPELKTRESAELLRVQLVNLLMPKQQFRLYDDIFPHYYFLSEVREGPNFQPTEHFGELAVSFTVYPFRISELPEGHDIWDDFNFELDVSQQVEFQTKPRRWRDLNIGDLATLGAWTNLDASERSVIKRSIGTSGKILDKRYLPKANSRWQYKIEGYNDFVLEQDIIEATRNPLEITLINPGTPSINPNVTVGFDTSILNTRDDRIYHFIDSTASYTHNEAFVLYPGENKLIIYGGGRTTVKFNFYKELI